MAANHPSLPLHTITERIWPAVDMDNARSTNNPLISLPNDMIIHLTNYLPKESIVLLSLTCKALRRLLTVKVDLGMLLDERITFLRTLQNNLPDYLTCRLCGWMYLWQQSAPNDYRCPCEIQKPEDPEEANHIATLDICPGRHICLTFPEEVVDLIVRAQRKGPQFGLPISYLVKKCLTESGILVHSQLRMVNDDLMLYNRLTMVLTAQQTLTIELLHEFDQGLCLHPDVEIAPVIWFVIVWNARYEDCAEHTIVKKCSRCATDYEVTLKKSDGGGHKITVELWRAFGSGSDGVKKMFTVRDAVFDGHSARRMIVDEPISRDLKGKFKAVG